MWCVCFLSVACYWLFGGVCCCLLRVVRCAVFAACCVLAGVDYVMSVPKRVLFLVWCSMCVVVRCCLIVEHCMQLVVVVVWCCLMIDVCNLLCVVCCVVRAMCCLCLLFGGCCELFAVYGVS